MEKFLQTCFLALLCLAGSPSSAQSRVADSPPEEPLYPSALHVSPHSGDTHRGGAILPDTFLKVQQHTAADCKLQTGDCQSPEFGLVDAIGSVGQEGGISSAQMGEGMLYIEIASADPPDTLWVTYWEHLLRDQLSVTPGTSIPVPGSYGNLFEGSLQKMVYRFEFPSGITDGFFSIGKGKSTLIHQWYFSSSDRVRIRFDLITGKTLFGGPEGDFYQTQHLLDQLFAQEQFNSDPVMVSVSKEGLFQDSLSSRLYKKALGQPDDLSVKLKVLATDSEKWGEFQDRSQMRLDSHPASGLLHQTSDSMADHQYSLLSARIAGELLSTGLTWAEMGRAVPASDPVQLQLFLDWIDEFGLDSLDIPHPLLIQGKSRLISLMAKLGDKKFLEEWKGFDSPLKDEVLAIYLLANFNSLGDELLPLLDSGQQLVSTSWITEKLESLASAYRSPVVSEGLADISGNPVDLKDFRGETLLIHFWISGCKFCIEDYRGVMQDLTEKYSGEPGVRIISVNMDKDRTSWLKSLDSGRYTSPLMLNLKASSGSGMAQHYRIHSFPQKMIVGRDSQVRLQLVTHLDFAKLSALLDRISNESSLSFSPTQTLNP